MDHQGIERGKGLFAVFFEKNEIGDPDFSAEINYPQLLDMHAPADKFGTVFYSVTFHSYRKQGQCNYDEPDQAQTNTDQDLFYQLVWYNRELILTA